MFGVILACIYYEFAIIGMWLFGMKINSENVDPRIDGTNFTNSWYQYSSFNDIIDAYIVLFSLMIVNNWNLVMEGYLDVTSKWSRLYFMSFHLITVLIALNLTIPTFLRFLLKEFDIRESEKRKNSKEDTVKTDTPPPTSRGVPINAQSPGAPQSANEEYMRQYRAKRTSRQLNVKIFSDLNQLMDSPRRAATSDDIPDHMLVMKKSRLDEILENAASK